MNDEFQGADAAPGTRDEFLTESGGAQPSVSSGRDPRDVADFAPQSWTEKGWTEKFPETEPAVEPAASDKPRWPIRWEFPWVTLMATVVCVLIYLALQHEPSPESDSALMRWGWRDAGAIWDGAWWSLIAGCFVHGELGHLVGNMCLFVIYAWRLEQVVGHAKWLGFLLLSAFFTAAVDLAWSGSHSYGASGVSTAVFGFFVAAWFRTRFLPAWIFIPVTLWSIVNDGMLHDQADLWTEMSTGVVPGDVAFPAHLAGYFFGALVGAVAFNGWRRWIPATVIATAVVAAAAPLVWAPRSYEWMLHQAERAYDTGQTEEAFAWLDRAELRRPDLPTAAITRASFCLCEGRIDEALAAADRAVPLEDAYCRRCSEVTAALASAPAGVAKGEAEEAKVGADSDPTQASEGDQEAGPPRSPVTGYVRRMRGQILLDLSRYDDADADFTKGLEHSPDDAVILALRGETRFTIGRHAEAIDDLSRAILLDPGYVAALVARGLAYRDRSERLAARIDLEAALDMLRPGSQDPEDADGLSLLGHAYVGLNAWPDAAAALDKAIAACSGNWHAVLLRSEVRSRMSKFDEAFADAETALAINAKSDYGWYVRGLALVGLGRFDEAEKSFTRSLELNPRSALAHVGRGDARQKLERLDEALEDFDAALELNDRLADAYAARATAHAARGETEEAADDRQTAETLIRVE